MIAGLDSSFDRPTPAQAAAAYAAGVRLWGGYIGTRDGLGLATRWTQADFDVIKRAGMAAIGYASGWDDPIAIHGIAMAWGILPGVDVESGIRDDGPWVRDWVTAAGAGLYGLASVHYHTGEPIGRGAAWNVMANYPGFDPGATWIGGLTPPAAPHGWQWRGGHSEFVLDVDSMWLDDWFNQGVDMTPEESAALFRIRDTTEQLWADLEKNIVNTTGGSAGAALANLLKGVAAIQTGSNALTPDQAKALADTAAAVARLEAALKQA